MAEYLMSEIQIPAIGDPVMIVKDKEARDDLSTAVVETSPSNPLTFTTRSAQNAQSAEIVLEPIQDLHGYDHPWPAGGGKNILPLTISRIKSLNTDGTWSDNNYVIKGVTYSFDVNDDGSISKITVSGNNTTDDYAAVYLLDKAYEQLYAGTIYVSGSTNSGANICYMQMNKVSTSGGSASVVGIIPNNTAYEFDSTNYRIQLILCFAPNKSADGYIYYPMISKTNTRDFTPYSNICPISGHTEVSVKVTNGKESTDPDYAVATDLTKDLGQEVYGGSYNPVSGELVVTIVEVDLKDLTFTYDSTNARFQANLPYATEGKWIDYAICSCYKKNSTNVVDKTFNIGWGRLVIQDSSYNGDVTAFTTAMQDAQVAYVTTQISTIQLTPNKISLLSGANTIWTDGTSIKVAYRDGKVATLANLQDAANNLQEQIDQNETMEDETTQLLYKLGVNNGLLFMEEV